MITALETVNGDTATVCDEGKCWGPSVTTTWKPPWHSMVQLPTLTAVVPAPPWYNNVNSDAIKMPAKVQANATCGLHAVNHLLACSPCPRVLHKDEFEQCGLRAGIGDSAEKLLDSRTGNYKFAVLRANLDARNLSVFSMTAADIESRFDEPFCQHVMPTGIHKVVGYLVRVPLHGGHWITLLPGRVVRLPFASSAQAVLCDSMHPQPFLTRPTEPGGNEAAIAGVRERCSHRRVSFHDRLRLLFGCGGRAVPSMADAVSGGVRGWRLRQ